LAKNKKIVEEVEEKKEKEINTFTFVNSINYDKKADYTDQEIEKIYVPFLVNRHFSYFIDTIMHANEMNGAYNLPKRMQFDYLINTIKSKKRFTKWIKKQNNEDIELVMNYFQYNRQRASEIMDFITPEFLDSIKNNLDNGGVE